MEGEWKVYGPYQKRSGQGVYAREVWYDKDGKRKDVSLGRVGDAYVDTVHVEAEVPWDLVDDLAGVVAYVTETNLSRRRIADPIKRFLRLLGLQHHTEERLEP